MDELKEFFNHYGIETMWKVLNTAPLYGWQKENILSEFIVFRRRIEQTYDYNQVPLSDPKKE